MACATYIVYVYAFIASIPVEGKTTACASKPAASMLRFVGVLLELPLGQVSFALKGVEHMGKEWELGRAFMMQPLHTSRTWVHTFVLCRGEAATCADKSAAPTLRFVPGVRCPPLGRVTGTHGERGRKRVVNLAPVWLSACMYFA